MTTRVFTEINTFVATCLLWVVFGLFLLSGQASGVVIHVPGNATTIQSGINQAADGDTVLVAAGTYSGPNNEGISLSGRKILLASEMGPEATILLTTDTLRTIVCVSGEDSLSIIDGFTISGGYETVENWSDPVRGGIRIENASPIFRNCIIRDCYADDGGGIYAQGGSARFDDCTITNNQALLRGGGAYCAGEDIRFTGCAFTSNRVFGPFYFLMASGGAVQNYGVLTLSNCDISFNRVIHESMPPRSNDYALSQGGGIFSLAGNLKVDSCRILHNSAGIGGAIVSALESFDLSHTLVFNNIADQYGAIIVLEANVAVQAPSRLINNTIACNYSGRISSDGIVFLNNATDLSLAMSLVPETIGTDQAEPAPHELTNNIFAFNGSTPVLVLTAADNIIVSHNNIWHTVSGPAYGGSISDQTGSEGNIAADPLFCDISDSGFTIDIISPCFQAGDNGANIGAFGANCVNYNFAVPKRVTLTLDEPTAAGNQALLDSVLPTLVPWDTLVLTSTLPRAEIDNLTITKPLYINGPRASGSNVFVLSENYNLSQRAVIYIRQFCVIDGLIVEAYHSAPQFRGFYAINSSGYPAIVSNCRLTSWEQDPAFASFDGSPLVRNCEFVNGVSAFGRFDLMASYNYWDGCIDNACIDDAIRADSLFFSGRIVFSPFLSDLPTDVTENGAPPAALPELMVSQNYPNPFNAQTTVSFSLRHTALTEVAVINILGETVKTIISRVLRPGDYKIAWDGTNESGDTSASGIYLMRIQSGAARKTVKMVLMK